MTQVASQLAVFVTASTDGDQLGRRLAHSGVCLVGATGSLTQLRRSLVRGSVRTPIVLCISLDEPTLRHHGEAVTGLLDDRCSFPTPVHAIGLMIQDPPFGWQSLGCDSIAASQSELEALLAAFDRRPMAEGNRFSFTPTDVLIEGSNHPRCRRADTRTADFRWPRR